MSTGADDVPRMLQCKLSPAEVQDKGQQLSSLYLSYGRVEEEKKAAGAVQTKKLKQLRAEMETVSDHLRSGTAPRTVMCRWVDDFEHGVKRLVRQDSGEVVEEATLSVEDLQEPLGFNS